MKESLQGMPASAPAPAGAPVQEGSRSGCGSVVRMIAAGVIAVLMLVFNIILLAGVGASESKCKSAGGSNSACRTEYSLHWWVVFFELICVALAIIAAFSVTVKREIGSGLQAWLAVNTALLAYIASLYNTQIEGLKNARGSLSDLKSANQAAMAGAVVLSIANLLYIMVMGSSYAPAVERPSRPMSSTAAPAPVYMQEMPPQHVAYNMPPPGQHQEVQGGVMNYNTGMPQQTYAPQPTYNMPQH